MSLAAAHPPGAADPTLEWVLAELTRLCDDLEALAARVQSLRHLTDWRARAATVFHDRAEAWAAEVGGLRWLAETARLDARHAVDASRWWLAG